MIDASHRRALALEPFTDSGSLSQAEELHESTASQIAFEEKRPPILLARQCTGEIGGGHRLSFLGDCARNQEFLQWSALLQVPQTHCQKPKVLGRKALRIRESD